MLRLTSLMILTIGTSVAAQSLQDRQQTWTHFDAAQEYSCVMSHPSDKHPTTIIRKGDDATVIRAGMNGKLQSEQLTCSSQTCSTAATYGARPDTFVASYYLLYPLQRLAIRGEVVYSPQEREMPIISVASEHYLDCSPQS